MGKEIKEIKKRRDNLMDIQNGEAAWINVSYHLAKEGHKFLSTQEINNGRYRILKTDRDVYLVMFKRDFFRSFNKYFRDEGATGLGETVNMENLKEAVSKGAMKVLFIYPNCHIYSISIESILSDGFRRTNKEGKETISFSIHLMKRENK